MENLSSELNPKDSEVKNTITQEDREKLAEAEMKRFIEEIKNDQKNTPTGQIKRLLNTHFVTPYEVLILGPEASDEELKKQYRGLSLLVHPDKNQDPKAAEAFHSKIINNFSC
jgi:hypothetical protein